MASVDLIKLVSAGEDIKVWNGAELEVQFSPHTSAPETSTVSWSPDGHFLAASSATGDSIIVSHHERLTSPVKLRTDYSQNFVRFSNMSSRTVITCGDHPNVLLWNLKSRKLQKKLNSSLQALNCITFNQADSHVACGSSMGEVMLINATSGVCNPVMKTATTRSICSLAFNTIAKSQLGALSEDSGFNLWDGNKRALILSYESQHIAPATGFAFSPVNDKLAVSVGLDKRIVFYDLTMKMIIMSTTLDEPITCIDFMDSMNMTVGTTTGKLYFYDLRATKTRQMIVAHQSPVNSIHYRQCKTRHSKSYDLSWKETRAAELFSPKLSQQNGSAVAGRNPFEESVAFSPVNTLATPKFNDTAIDSPLDVLLSSFNFSNQTAVGDGTIMLENKEKSTAQMTSDDYDCRNGTQCESPSRKMAKVSSPAPAIVPSASPAPAPLAAADAPIADQVEPLAAAANAAVVVPSLDFSLLRSVVFDVVDDLSVKIHKDIVNLHVDVIKMFQLQQTYFEKMLEQPSRNEELLLAEIERLHAENHRLRMNIN